MVQHENPGRDKALGRLVTKLLLVAAGMFAFGVFAMPPLYDKFCEITGIGQAGVEIAEESAAADIEVSGRTVKLMFDATANSALPWEFAPVERSMEVTLGELTVASYSVNSMADTATAGRAVYNVTPAQAAPYFVKTECFCFSRQKLAAGEQKEMPVRFYIKPDLPEDIEELTLSYTFFLNEDPDSAETADASSGTDAKET
jgi:cytochrome c oxidase assembly protein subunit 11